jgi:hypothetical protein
MKAKIVLALLGAAACAPLWAAPPACVNGTLATYIRLGAEGCSAGGVTYANFTYSKYAGGGARTVPAEEISVTIALLVEGPIFSFSAPWEVAKGQTLDSIIQHTVAPPCGDNLPVFMNLSLGPAKVEGDAGAVSVDEPTNVGDLEVFDRCEDGCDSKPGASLHFKPVSVVLITNHVALNGGTAGASLQSFADKMVTCPVCG